MNAKHKIYIQKDGLHLILWETDGKMRRPQRTEKVFPKDEKFLFANKEYSDYNDLIDNIQSGRADFCRDYRYRDKYGRNMFLAVDRITLSEKGFFHNKPALSVFLACVHEGKLYYIYTNDVDKELFVVEDADSISEEILHESLKHEEIREFLFGEDLEAVHEIWFGEDDDDD